MSKTVSLFTFGSLTLPEVMQAVTGRVFPARRAWVPGYAARLLRDECFPGLAEMDEQRAHGMFYQGVDRESLELIDRFEGDYYRRVKHFIMFSKQETGLGYIYLLKPYMQDILTQEPWDEDHFRRFHLTRFLHTCREFRENSRDSASER